MHDRWIVAHIFEYSSTNARISKIYGDFQSESLEFLIYNQTHFFFDDRYFASNIDTKILKR